ncbi:hypothetical protein KUCAC02_019569 [Chaenocephalus aceratus]|uniref:Uncharacterized protein n=1 Tax=Chaenocephalus aceratus TaxID=36190 RepID=A0ACB9VQJ6_CHAAC|nr:hypothetical protein KUCAC02_019569 [Chaenocephalus aceratus]
MIRERSPLSWQWNREVFLWDGGSGLQPWPCAGSPYPIQLGFVIGSPGLKDTVHHLTRLNACKMSNQRCVWSLQRLARPPSCRRPRGTPETLLMISEQISGSPHMRSLSHDSLLLGETGRDTGAHHTSNSFNIPSIVSAADCDITPDPEPARYGS